MAGGHLHRVATEPRGKIRRSFLAAVGSIPASNLQNGRLIVIAFNGYLLPGLVVKVNFFLTFLLQEFVPGLALLDIIVSNDFFLIANRGLRALGGCGRGRRFDRSPGWGLDNGPSVINVDHMVAAIISHSDGVYSIRIVEDSYYPSGARNVRLANHGGLHWLRQCGELNFVCSRSSV